MRAFISSVFALIIGVVGYAQNDTVVSLITAFPGTDIYELEGHSAIRINMGPERDFAVSYGIFNFNAPNFVYRFVKGETDYMVGLVPFNYFIEEYVRQGRRVEELPLNLTVEEKSELINLLSENLLPENRVYRYNYVKDNCSTRPLKMVESAIGDTLRLGHTQWERDVWSFRDVMRSYHKNYPWYQFGIDIALGSGIDYPLNPREFAFVPMIMSEQVSGASGPDGRKIAGTTHALIDVAPDAAIMSPTPWYLTPVFVCWVVFAVLIGFTVGDIKRGKVTKWVDALYYGILGLAGLLLTFLIFVSVHEATSPNYLYLWLNPFCFIPAIFIWWNKGRKVVSVYQIVNFVVLLCALCAWPLIPQSANPAFLPLVLADLLRSFSFVYIYRSSSRR